MTAFLPHHDPNLKRRQRKLASQQRRYRYSYDYVSPLALCKRVPFRDHQSLGWVVKMTTRVFTAVSNVLRSHASLRTQNRHKANFRVFRSFASVATFNMPGITECVSNALLLGGTETRPESYEDFAKVFRAFGIPPIHRDCTRDDVFAEMRLAGPNPVMLQRIDAPDERFPVTENHFRETLPDDSLEAAGQEGRLYLCDYRDLDQIEDGTYPCESIANAPLALFATHKSTGTLVPIAIQCNQTPGAHNPVMTPNDGYNWKIAKIIVSVADGNLHEIQTHLGRTHLLMDPFAMATYRHLASNHPIGLLLRPHFVGTLHINNQAHKYLIGPKGGVEAMCSGSIESIGRAVGSALKEFSFNGAMLPAQLRSRGVDETDLLPNYPFRDDSLLYWNAIRTWVSDYVDIYYTTEQAIREDQELQNWCRELSARDGGRVPDCGQDGELKTREYLVDFVTMIIHTCTTQHAAVNFPQFDLMSYCGAFPLTCCKKPPVSRNGATEQDYLDVFPPIELAHLQACWGHTLGTLRYTQLSRYGRSSFRDNRVREPLQQFQNRIASIGDTITERNETRRPYNILQPAGVPQSINI